MTEFECSTTLTLNARAGKSLNIYFPSALTMVSVLSKQPSSVAAFTTILPPDGKIDFLQSPPATCPLMVLLVLSKNTIPALGTCNFRN